MFLISVNDPFLFPHVSHTTVNPTTVPKHEACLVAPGERLATTFITRLFHLSGFCDPDSCLGLVSTSRLWWIWACPSAEKPSGWVGRRNGPSLPSLFKPLVSNSLQLSVNITFWMEWEKSGAGRALTASPMKINSAVSQGCMEHCSCPRVFLLPAFTLWTQASQKTMNLQLNTHTTQDRREPNPIILITSDKSHN